MREITEIANYTVEIWRRPRQRHMRLTVRPDGRVRVTCSRRRSKREIFDFVNESRSFIEKRVLELESARRRFPVKQMLSGESILYFGRRLQLELVWTWTERIRVSALVNSLEMTVPLGSTRQERARALREFFRRSARSHLLGRVQRFSGAMGVVPSTVSIRGQSTRWGSCSARREISLNMKLLCAPPEVIDYVVVHELAHVRHMNHSPGFWALVGQFFPAYRQAKQWLKEHEQEIAAQFLQTELSVLD